MGIDDSWPVLDGLLVRAQYYRNGAGERHPPRLALLSDAIQPPTCASLVPSATFIVWSRLNF